MNIKCWNCGQDREVQVTNDMLRNAYDAGYRKGLEDFRKRLEEYRYNAEREDSE